MTLNIPNAQSVNVLTQLRALVTQHSAGNTPDAAQQVIAEVFKAARPQTNASALWLASSSIANELYGDNTKLADQAETLENILALLDLSEATMLKNIQGLMDLGEAKRFRPGDLQ